MKANDFHVNIINGKDFISEILEAVKKGTLKEPFYPKDIKKAVPGWGIRTYIQFPWKHCLQNKDLDTTALFYYIGEDYPEPKNPIYQNRLYRLLRNSDVNQFLVN